MSTLMQGILSQNMEEVLQALNAGADVNCLPGIPATPLIQAVASGTHEIRELLIMRGANVNGKDDFDETPLHYAASKKTAKLLLRHKADINALSAGRTPIFSAIFADAIDVVKLLLAHDPNLTILDYDKRTPLEFARQLGRTEMVSLLESHIKNTEVKKGSSPSR